MSLRPSGRGFGNNDHLLLLADLGIALAVAFPQPTWGRRIVAFLFTAVAIPLLIASVVLAIWAGARCVFQLHLFRLRSRLIHPYAGIRTTALQQLAEKWGSLALPSMVRMLQDSDPAVRRAAAAEINKIGYEAVSAVAALLQALRDPDRAVQLDAALALCKTGRELDSAASTLASFATDTDVEIRGQALQALKLMGKAPSPQLSPSAS
jgi:hypothetical protein